MINECVITQQEALDSIDSGDSCLTRILIDKGFEYAGSPTRPFLSGSVSVTRDMETGNYLYKQTTREDL